VNTLNLVRRGEIQTMKRGRSIVLILFCLIVFGFGIGFVNADSSTGLIFKANQPVELKIPCVYNGTYCSSSATCNLTIIYQGSIDLPNGTTIVKDGIMTYNGPYWNYTVPDNTNLGVYKCSMNCMQNGLGGVKNFDYTLTSTGDNSNWSFWLILAFFSLILVTMAMYSGNEYIMFIASGATIVTGMYSMIYGVMSITNIYTQSISFVILGLGLFFLIISSLKAIADASQEGDSVGGWGPGGEDDYDYFKS
jgi:hypothetical protein